MKSEIKMNGVVAYIVETSDGRITLTMDDLSSSKQPPTSWCQEFFYTSNSYDSEAMKKMSLTK
jgi:hypothetical protein